MDAVIKMERETCMIHKIDPDFPKCKKSEEKIMVAIQVGDEQYPICEYHWGKLVDKQEPED